VHFYEVGGLLVRRPKRAPREVNAEVWKDDGWRDYTDLESILRHGHRLRETDALALLHRVRHADRDTRWSDQHAKVALRAPRTRP